MEGHPVTIEGLHCHDEECMCAYVDIAHEEYVTEQRMERWSFSFSSQISAIL